MQKINKIKCLALQILEKQRELEKPLEQRGFGKMGEPLPFPPASLPPTLRMLHGDLNKST